VDGFVDIVDIVDNNGGFDGFITVTSLPLLNAGVSLIFRIMMMPIMAVLQAGKT